VFAISLFLFPLYKIFKDKRKAKVAIGPG